MASVNSSNNLGDPLTPISLSGVVGEAKASLVHQMPSASLYSHKVQDPVREGEGCPRRHPLVGSGPLVELFDDTTKTVFEALYTAAQKYAHEPFLGWRPMEDGVAQDYVWMTFEKVAERVKNLASGLASFNLPVQTAVGLYSINRPEWVLAEHACVRNNLVTIPLYDTLGDEAIEFICEQTEMQIIVASNDKALNLFRLKKSLPMIKYIILMDDDIPEELVQKAAEHNTELVKLSNLEKRGMENPTEPRPPIPQDLFTICYTSGTTGRPKGVMLPHSAIIAMVSALLSMIGFGKHADPNAAENFMSLGPGVTHLSYLPLAHVFERMALIMMAVIGGSVGFYQGDMLKLMDDLATLRPVLFLTVPRLLNRVYDKVIAGVANSGGLKRFLFHYALKTKQTNLKNYGQYEHWLWDRLVFNQLRNRLGGRVKYIVTGSAPISPEIIDFFRVCFSCQVFEGYGQTETAAGSTLTVRGDWTAGHVGVPCPCNEIKLIDIPEMGYSTKDTPRERGEICIRGPNCFSGYFKAEELTREALDEEGWVHTGDVGEWDEMGRLRIIDRKKNIFKLAQGEYISPEKIENVLSRRRFIAQAFVEGNSLKAFLVAVIVPDYELLESWAKKNAIEYEQKEELCSKKEVKDMIMKEIKSLGRDGSGELKGFEIPKAIHLEPEPFSVANNMLTATFKLKRHEAKKHYAEIISKLYDEVRERE